MKYDTIRRTGSATSPVRYLVGLIGHDTKTTRAIRTVLPTAIIKVAGPDKFRQSGHKIPVEQYAFQVDGRTYERFADAASIVLAKHHASLINPEADDVQEYVKLALRMMKGDTKRRSMKAPEDYVPAVKLAA